MTETPKGTRAADDFSFINSRMKEIEKEREDVQAARNKEEAEREAAAIAGAGISDTSLGFVDYTTMVINPGRNFGENTQLNYYALAAAQSIASQTGRTKFQRHYHGAVGGRWLSERYMK
jgi:hypothetical protein